MTPSRLRRFRFGLRTFFIVVAVLGVGCAWVAREVARIREREAVLEWMIDSDPCVNHWHPIDAGAVAPNWWRRWLGETYVPVVFRYTTGASAAEIDRVKSAFPEATVEPWPE